MTSQVNPYNIDGTYPIAGQDNDSQGFRDNFTNTVNNFAFVKAEIEDLQARAVLKSALTNSTLDNSMAYAKLIDAQLQSYSETFYALAAGSYNINFDKGNYQKIETSQSGAITFQGWPAAGQLARMQIRVTVTDIAHKLTLPAACVLGQIDAIPGIDSLTITYPAVGDYFYEFTTSDGGINIHARELGRAPAKMSGNLSVTGTISSAGSITPHYDYAVITSGQSTAVESLIPQVFLDSENSSTIASHAIILPAGAVNGQRVSIRVICPVTSLSFPGSTVRYVSPDVATAGNVTVDLMYSTTQSVWLRT